MDFLPLFLHSIQPHGCAETRSVNMWKCRGIRADLHLPCCAGGRWGQIPKSVHSKCVGVKTRRGQMCLTSEEIRNNAEFQTGFLGTGSPDQSKPPGHCTVSPVQHRVEAVGSQTCTVEIMQTRRALFPILNARTIELPVKKFGVRWVQIGVCCNQKNMPALKSSWDWSGGL